MNRNYCAPFVGDWPVNQREEEADADLGERGKESVHHGEHEQPAEHRRRRDDELAFRRDVFPRDRPLGVAEIDFPS